MAQNCSHVRPIGRREGRRETCRPGGRKEVIKGRNKERKEKKTKEGERKEGRKKGREGRGDSPLSRTLTRGVQSPHT